MIRLSFFLEDSELNVLKYFQVVCLFSPMHMFVSPRKLVLVTK